MEFRPLSPELLPTLHPYFANNPYRLSDFTLGYLLMWMPYAKTTLAEVDECLLLRSEIGNKIRFTYPIHPHADQAAELRALTQLETWCVEHREHLALTTIPLERLPLLTHRYGRDLILTNPRTWRDYLYTTTDFIDYAGKRFAGQRNHVSKFKRTHPTATFRPITPQDLPAIHTFLQEYATRQYAKHSFIANEELHGTKQLLDAFEKLHQIGGLLEADGRVIAITLGEITGDTLVVHVEKALTDYEGAYPTIAQAFAKASQREGLLYINREDDAGDCGLRKSKLQYNPIRLLDKYTLIPRRIIETIDTIPEITSERLHLHAIPDEDTHHYGKLARDITHNKYWGWDWRTTWTGEGDPRDKWFLDLIRNDFQQKNELPLGIYLNSIFIGEAVFHNFTYDNAVELGVRLLPNYQHHGFATETIRTMANYALCFWGLERVTAKCYRDNLPSARMLQAAGLRHTHTDTTYHHYTRTAKN